MVHYLTVHFKDPAWIRMQTEFIRKYSPPHTLIHAVLTDIPLEFNQYFDKVYPSDSHDHATNLNKLASEISKQYSYEDILIFIDGDAFPIAPIDKYVTDLKLTRLIGIQRLENNGDLQPHPCFTMLKLVTWDQLKGDWSSGYKWHDAQGDRVTDVGGEMLRKLEENKIDWRKLQRTNKMEYHELFFGIYDDTIYHHGAGFRRVFGGRVSAVKAGIKEARKRKLARFFHLYVPEKIEWWLFGFNLHPLSKVYAPLERKFKPLSIKVFNKIKKNPEYVYEFLREE